MICLYLRSTFRSKEEQQSIPARLGFYLARAPYIPGKLHPTAILAVYCPTLTSLFLHLVCAWYLLFTTPSSGKDWRRWQLKYQQHRNNNSVIGLLLPCLDNGITILILWRIAMWSTTSGLFPCQTLDCARSASSHFDRTWIIQLTNVHPAINLATRRTSKVLSSTSKSSTAIVRFTMNRRGTETSKTPTSTLLPCPLRWQVFIRPPPPSSTIYPRLPVASASALERPHFSSFISWFVIFILWLGTCDLRFYAVRWYDMNMTETNKLEALRIIIYSVFNEASTYGYRASRALRSPDYYTHICVGSELVSLRELLNCWDISPW